MRENCHKERESLLKLKDPGELVKPTVSVVIVCEETEKCFQKLDSALEGKLPKDSGIDQAIGMAILGNINTSKVFNSLSEHNFDGSVTHNHTITLIKTIAHCYSKIRLHHLAKETNARVSGKKVRKALTRLVLFKNQ